MLTLEEQERRAYASGDTHTAGLLAQVIDAENEVDEVQEKLDDLDSVVDLVDKRVKVEVAKIIALA